MIKDDSGLFLYIFLADPRLRLPSLQQAAARGELDMAWALGW